MPRPVAIPMANDKRRRPDRTQVIRVLKPAMRNISKSVSATLAAHANDTVHVWGSETSPREMSNYVSIKHGAWALRSEAFKDARHQDSYTRPDTPIPRIK